MSSASPVIEPASASAYLRTRLQIGAVTLDRLVESDTAILRPDEVYPDCTPEALRSELGWLAPRYYDAAKNQLVLAFQGFLLRSEGRLILVDTCVGDCKRRTRSEFDDKRWNWLDRLYAAGVSPEEIDIVVCTHFHVDHVGWNTRLADGRWVPTFPNARYLFTREEWTHWLGEKGKAGRERSGDYVADSVIPVMEAGLADFVPMDHRLTGEIALMPAPGHTPGMVCVDIQSKSGDGKLQRAIIVGDLLHTLLQVKHPHWSTNFCADPEGSRRTRTEFMEKFADSGTLVLPAHFLAPTAGTIERDGTGFRFRYLD